MNNCYKRLDGNFYANTDVCEVAKQLLGKVLVSTIDGWVTSGKIVETEAYSYREKACHAYMNRNTNRTKVLFAEPGTSYVYLCYGIHKLLNVVTNVKGVAEAVLIRAVEPMEGLNHMLQRRGFSAAGYPLTSGPGRLSQALGITLEQNKTNLFGHPIWIEDRNLISEPYESSPRIGVGYAKEDALLPWRFSIKDNPWVSKGNNSYPDF